MAVRAIFAMRPMAAAPLLPSVLARIRRTPTARLATVYRLTGGRFRSPPIKTLLARENPFRLPPTRPLGAQWIRSTHRPPSLGDLGKSIYVYSLVSGDIIGTPLAISAGEFIPLGTPACGNCAPTVDFFA